MRSILIIDDDFSFLEIIKEVIEDLNMPIAVHSSSDGLRAYLMARTQEFDLIFADYHLPRLGKTELINGLRENSKKKDVPIVVVTGDPELARRETKGIPQVEVLDKLDALERILALLRKIAGGRASSGAGQGREEPEPTAGAHLLSEVCRSFSHLVAEMAPGSKVLTGGAVDVRDTLKSPVVREAILVSSAAVVSGGSLVEIWVFLPEPLLRYLSPHADRWAQASEMTDIICKSLRANGQILVTGPVCSHEARAARLSLLTSGISSRLSVDVGSGSLEAACAVLSGANAGAGALTSEGVGASGRRSA